MTTLESWILSFLLNSLWQVPLIFLAGWLAARAVRRLGPSAEHRIWVGALLLESTLPAIAALPGTTFQFPWNLFASRTPALAEAHVSVLMGPGSVWTAVHPPAAFLAAATLVYAAMFVWFAARLAWRCTKLRALRRESVLPELTPAAARCWQRCCHRFSIHGATLAVSARVFSPVTLGITRKFVLLPVALLADLPESDLATVLAHECAHMRRNDFLRNLLGEMLALPISYHPFHWLTRARLTETREMVCDRMAAALSGPAPYAESLLRLAARLVHALPARTAPGIGIFDTRTLERRLMKLTQKTAELRGLRRLLRLAACAALGLGVCASALALHLRVDALAAVAANPPVPLQPPDHPVAVSPKIMQGNRISGPIPKYPPEAKKERIQGTVTLSAIISKEGRVAQLTVASGPKLLQASSLDAVRQWIYKPFLLNGNPVDVKTSINVIYSLRK